MSNDRDLRNPLFRNWVRGAYALNYLKEGLKGFVDSTAKQHHQECLNKIWKTYGTWNNGCNECTADNLLPDHPRRHCIQRFRSKCFCNTSCTHNVRRKCPNKFCSLMYDLIVLDHEEQNPFWANSNPEKWYSDHWEVAKCFLGTTGYDDKNSASDIDATGLLCISINNIFIRDKIDDVTSFIQAREVRNDILHTGSYELDDDKLRKYIDVMVAVLKDRRTLACDEDAQEAVEMLIKLKNGQIHISSHHADEMRSSALKAIEEKKLESLQELDKTKIAIMTDLDNKFRQKTEQAVQTIYLKVDQTEKQIKNNTEQIQRDITQKSKDAMLEGKVTLLNEAKREIASHVEHIYKRLELKSGEILSNEKEKIVREVKEDIKREETLANSRLNSNLNYMSKQCIAAIEKKGAELNVNVSAINELRSDVTNSVNSQEQVRVMLEKQRSAQITTEEKLQKVTENQDKFYQQTATRNKRSPDFQSKEEYNIKRALQDYLINRYRTYYIKTEVSPLLPEMCVCVDEVFVPLLFKCTDGKTNTSPTTSLFGLLGKGGCRLKNIFLTGDSGVGKTTLCKRLLSSWCRAHGQTEGRSSDETDDEEIKAMKAYEFLLFVSLRDVYTEGSIEGMIESQLLIDDTFKHYLSNVLKTKPETCLVLLDGLDEWSPETLPKHPCIPEGLPIQKGEYTTLFTSRPWKIEEVRPTLMGRNREVEIIGIGKSASEELVAKMLKCFEINDRDLSLNAESYKDFLSELKKKNMQNLRSVPLMLILLLCLWVENKCLEDSKTRIYTSVLELLLLQAQKRYRNNHHFNSLVRRLNPVKYPSVLLQNQSLKKFDPLLQSLNKLAFDALFREDRKTALVFKQSDLREYGLIDDEIELCLRIGLLSQKKISGISRLFPVKSVSFIHKSFQEYFAAVYISAYKTAFPLRTVRKICYDFKTIFEMSNVFHFVSGMNVELMRQFSVLIGNVADADERIIKYRQRDDSDILLGYTKIRKVQALIFTFIEECLNNGLACRNIQLLDICIDRSLPFVLSNCNETASVDFKYLKYIDNSVRSLVVRKHSIPEETQEYLSNVRELHTICCDEDSINSETIYDILFHSRHTLRCLSLTGYKRLPRLGTFKNLTDLQVSGGTTTMIRVFEILRNVSNATEKHKVYLHGIEILCPDQECMIDNHFNGAKSVMEYQSDNEQNIQTLTFENVCSYICDKYFRKVIFENEGLTLLCIRNAVIDVGAIGQPPIFSNLDTLILDKVSMTFEVFRRSIESLRHFNSDILAKLNIAVVTENAVKGFYRLSSFQLEQSRAKGFVEFNSVRKKLTLSDGSEPLTVENVCNVICGKFEVNHLRLDAVVLKDSDIKCISDMSKLTTLTLNGVIVTAKRLRVLMEAQEMIRITFQSVAITKTDHTSARILRKSTSPFEERGIVIPKLFEPSEEKLGVVKYENGFMHSETFCRICNGIQISNKEMTATMKDITVIPEEMETSNTEIAYGVQVLTMYYTTECFMKSEEYSCLKEITCINDGNTYLVLNDFYEILYRSMCLQKIELVCIDIPLKYTTLEQLKGTEIKNVDLKHVFIPFDLFKMLMHIWKNNRATFHLLSVKIRLRSDVSQKPYSCILSNMPQNNTLDTTSTDILAYMLAEENLNISRLHVYCSTLICYSILDQIRALKYLNVVCLSSVLIHSSTLVPFIQCITEKQLMKDIQFYNIQVFYSSHFYSSPKRRPAELSFHMRHRYQLLSIHYLNNPIIVDEICQSFFGFFKPERVVLCDLEVSSYRFQFISNIEQLKGIILFRVTLTKEALYSVMKEVLERKCRVSVELNEIEFAPEGLYFQTDKANPLQNVEASLKNQITAPPLDLTVGFINMPSDSYTTWHVLLTQTCIENLLFRFVNLGNCEFIASIPKKENVQCLALENVFLSKTVLCNLIERTRYIPDDDKSELRIKLKNTIIVQEKGECTPIGDIEIYANSRFMYNCIEIRDPDISAYCFDVICDIIDKKLQIRILRVLKSKDDNRRYTETSFVAIRCLGYLELIVIDSVSMSRKVFYDLLSNVSSLQGGVSVILKDVTFFGETTETSKLNCEGSDRVIQSKEILIDSTTKLLDVFESTC